jgi:hypothetical protein
VTVSVGEEAKNVSYTDVETSTSPVLREQLVEVEGKSVVTWTVE